MKIKKRTKDWWFFILLPLLVFGVSNIFSYSSGEELIFIVVQQLFFYSLVLSSTEIGIRNRANLNEEQIQFRDIWSSVGIVIFSALFLIGVNQGDIFIKWKYFFLIISIIFALGSILLSNQNDLSGIPDFQEDRIKEQKEFSEKVEKEKNPYKGVEI